MKNYLMVMMLSAFALTACDNPNIQQTAKNLGVENITDIGTNMIANAVQAECENQLQNGGEFADLILTAEQKANLCGCTANELKNSLSQDKLASFIKNGAVDTQAVSDVVTGAMAICTAKQPNIATSQANEQGETEQSNKP